MKAIITQETIETFSKICPWEKTLMQTYRGSHDSDKLAIASRNVAWDNYTYMLFKRDRITGAQYQSLKSIAGATL